MSVKHDVTLTPNIVKSGKRTQRYRLEPRVKQRLSQRNLVIISFTGLVLFTFTYLYFNIGSPVKSKAAVSYPQLTFSNQVLISGTDGYEGAIYKFSNVCPGVDAQIHVKDVSSGAILADIDYYSTGRGPAWQPAIQIAPFTTAYVDWEIKFVKSGTNIDTALSSFAITAMSEKENAEKMKQFICALSPADYYRMPSMPLNISYSGNTLEADETPNSMKNVSAGSMQPIIQMNYVNVSSMQYRTGATNMSAEKTMNLFNVYFKSFFSGTAFSIPADIINFSGEKRADNTINLKWETTAEKDNSHFLIEKSIDGKIFKELCKINGKGENSNVNSYSFPETSQAEEKNYYTISQTDFNGGYVKLKTICILGNGTNSPVIIESAVISPVKGSLEIKYGSASNALLRISLSDIDGTEIRSELAQATKGSNDFKIANLTSLKKGVYFVNIDNYKLKYKAVKAVRL